MKIFISWSGERSHKVAQLLDTWIQCVIQAVEPWISSKDIDKGSLWFSEVSNKLATTQNGIVCLTKANLNKPWILFESGALAKGLSTNRVFTFLIDLEPKDVKDPLAQFNHTLAKKDSLYHLMSSINKGLGESALKENILINVFDTYWPQFEKEFNQILKDTPEEEVKEERPKDDLLSEILYSVRGIDRRLRSIEDPTTTISYDEKINHMRRLLRTAIEDLDLSVQSYNVLKAAKINTIGELVQQDTHELLKYRNFGKKSLVEIEELLQEKGLTFGMDLSKYGI
jgi:hypothetical protein